MNGSYLKNPWLFWLFCPNREVFLPEISLLRQIRILELSSSATPKEMSMNGNVHDELGLIIEFQTAVLKALKLVILEMDSTTVQGWIGNNTALKRVLKETLCPSSDALLELTLAQVFTPERCAPFGDATRSRMLNQIRSQLGDEGRRQVKLKDLLSCTEADLRKFPNVGRKVIGLVHDVLGQRGLKLHPE